MKQVVRFVKTVEIQNVINMKFKVEIEVEILDEELLELINNDREWNDKELYNSINEISNDEIMRWTESEEGYFYDDIRDYGFDIEKITIIN